MSYLQNQLAAFKGDVSSASSKLARSGNLQVPARPSPTPSSSSATGAVQPELKRKRPETSNVVFSQPADSGTGQELMTQLTYAVDYLREKDKPFTFKDIYDYLSIQNADANTRRNLEKVLQQHPKVEWQPNAINGKHSYRYLPMHKVRSADELEALLQRQQTAKGIPVKELKDGWSGAIDAIDSLEREGKVVAVRNKKDNTAKLVWSDDPSLRHPVDGEFQSLWHAVKTPVNPGDLRRELIDFGLNPTSQVKPARVHQQKEKKKKATRRGGKTTNTHMAGVLKDFSHLRRA